MDSALRELVERLDEAIKASRELTMPQVALSMTDAFTVRDLLRRQPSVEEVRGHLNGWFYENTGFAVRDSDPGEVSAYYGSWITIRTDRLARQIAQLYKGEGG